MIIRFEYNYNMEYLLTAHSKLTIEGTGEWDVNEEEFAEEFLTSKEDYKTFEDYCLNYFWMTLDINDNAIKFNSKDLEVLEKYCKEYQY